MSAILDRLEAQVTAAVDTISTLRDRLESRASRRGPAGDVAPPATSDVAGVERQGRLADEVARLRAERAQLRERIRALIREIDRAGV